MKKEIWRRDWITQVNVENSRKTRIHGPTYKHTDGVGNDNLHWHWNGLHLSLFHDKTKWMLSYFKSSILST